jgi:hypothetical protein
VLAISPLTLLLGRAAGVGVAALLIMTALHTALYALRKNRADAAWLDAAGSDAEA